MNPRVALVASAVVALNAQGAVAQQPADPEAPGNCTLAWESRTPQTFGTAVRDGPAAHTTYVSGRMLWTCGTATMEADSAVKSDRLRKVDLFGDVVYQDSIRTLQSTYLTYFEIDDLVIADEDVVLVRLVDQSRLTGPHVEFLRAVSGVDELTTATGRPHMTFYPESEESQEPFEIDADQAQFAGEDEARFQGEVVLERSDVKAEADSAYLTRDDGVGIMWGSPWFEAEEVRLEGDTIRFRSEDEELKEVHAEGNGFALGEQFEVRSELIDIQLANEEIERVWSHGEGLSEALSGDHLLFGDSLRFAMFESQIDTIYSVGRAVGIQGDSTAASQGLKGIAPLDELPVVGGPATLDSVANDADSLAMVHDSIVTIAPPPDPVVQPSDTVTEPSDSATVEAPDAEGAPELIEELLQSVEVGDSTGASASAQESTKVEGSGEGTDASFVGGPPLSIDGSSNWVRGDTLIAVFERVGGASPDSASLDPSLGLADRIEDDPMAGGVADSVGIILGDSTTNVAADSAITAIAESATLVRIDSVANAAADNTALREGPLIPPVGDLIEASAAATNEPSANADGDPLMKLMTVIGNASSFYRQVRDSVSTDKPSRNYMIGDRIDIVFEEGEPRTVLGVNAIGVFLEPEEAIATNTASAAATAPTSGPDALSPVADTLGGVQDTLLVDSLGVKLDSTSLPDTAAVRPDSIRALRGRGSTGSAPPGDAPDHTNLEPALRRSRG